MEWVSCQGDWQFVLTSQSRVDFCWNFGKNSTIIIFWHIITPYLTVDKLQMNDDCLSVAVKCVAKMYIFVSLYLVLLLQNPNAFSTFDFVHFGLTYAWISYWINNVFRYSHRKWNIRFRGTTNQQDLVTWHL